MLLSIWYRGENCNSVRLGKSNEVAQPLGAGAHDQIGQSPNRALHCAATHGVSCDWGQHLCSTAGLPWMVREGLSSPDGTARLPRVPQQVRAGPGLHAASVIFPHPADAKTRFRTPWCRLSSQFTEFVSFSSLVLFLLQFPWNPDCKPNNRHNPRLELVLSQWMNEGFL